ncbi:CoA pyrophosphatase [Dermacoccus sp. 147Ba]|uniref:NUDIX hydrolase n=1 Tax=Dermacoccus TaxID=57495 RepID=UPI00101D34B6|nr:MULTISPECIES: CoA pyrophosphatase [Dermacoccus]RYI22311.1 CoA pyrophosphatase [Dermacoccus sp. 147Ba]
MSVPVGDAAPPPWLNTVLDAGRRGDLCAGWPRPEQGSKASAILMLFGPNDDGGEDVVLTERATNLRKHAGQVSFPGGGVEPQDVTFTDTALREANEEIGLVPEGVHVMGELQPVALPVTNYEVCPVLAWWNVPSDISVLDPVEVARVARISVRDLVDPANRHTVTHPRGFKGPGFEVDGFYIWGFTAFVLDAVLTTGGVARSWNRDDERQVPDRFLS